MNGRLALSRGLTGVCCKVLIGMLFAGSALDVAGLEKWTGVERHALGRALRLLEDLELVVAQVGAHRREVWLPAGDLLLPGIQLEQNVPTGSSSSSRELTIGSELSLLLPEKQLEQNVPTEIGLALDAAGIREPARSSLAALEFVTVDLIEGHVRDCKAEGARIGAAIYRIKNNWPVREAGKREAVSFFAEEELHEEQGPLVIEIDWARALSGTCSECGGVGLCWGIRDAQLCLSHFKMWKVENLGLRELDYEFLDLNHG